MHGAEAGDDLRSGCPRAADEEGVEPVLLGQSLRDARRTPREGSDAPLRRVARMLGVPGGVRPEEVADTEVDDAHGSGGPPVGLSSGAPRGGPPTRPPPRFPGAAGPGGRGGGPPGGGP